LEIYPEIFRHKWRLLHQPAQQLAFGAWPFVEGAYWNEIRFSLGARHILSLPQCQMERQENRSVKKIARPLQAAPSTFIGAS
jgi:hypothetical protein